MSEAERIIRALMFAVIAGTLVYLVSVGMNTPRVWPGVVLMFCTISITTMGLTRGKR